MPTQPKLEALHAATGPDLRRLLLVDEVLCNPRLHKAYRIENGILVRLIEEAVDVAPGAHQRSMAYEGDVASLDPRTTAQAG